MSEQFWRQTDIVDQERLGRLTLSLIGCGGIGSPTAICLSKMGVGRLDIFDDDMIETHNLPSTMYRPSDIGQWKVDALENLIQTFSPGVKVNTVEETIDPEACPSFGGVTISGVDSMKSRQGIWEMVLENRFSVPYYIDGRMGGQTAQIITVNPCTPKSVEFYESRLASDDDVPDAPCTNRAIIYNTFMIASLICWQVRNYIMDQPLPREMFFDFISRQWIVSKEIA